MSKIQIQHLHYLDNRLWHGLVVGRAGLDLYPQPSGSKTRDAGLFASDVGGSGANIAVAMRHAGGEVGLISALSDDSVGEYVRQRLTNEGIDLQLLQTTSGDERTSLAIAEERSEDCEVVIYRNNPADLRITCDEAIRLAISQSDNLIVTGTSLIESDSRKQTLEMMDHAKQNNCKVWLDLDYRHWNWPDIKTTRSAYQKAAEQADVLVGNEDEFNILQEDINAQAKQCAAHDQVIILKRGVKGCSLFSGGARLDTGIYALPVCKPYGSGDAFLGNVIMNYMSSGDWQQAIEAGSAAAALVVSQRGCVSAMPNLEEIELLQKRMMIKPTTKWS
ncbi:MAG: PfkB family carbohydrate kinase [Candidatus Thioglobus sp.]|jgi:5-dehydro-2-deoxygluconokinase|nr:PfkB family carbohydrate kinase [Candidatus Thioglobus sp.]|tara:strand:- start:13 stop:1011 length:999 start_codon:yes stop_codon:yes gene_type:complete